MSLRWITGEGSSSSPLSSIVVCVSSGMQTHLGMGITGNRLLHFPVLCTPLNGHQDLSSIPEGIGVECQQALDLGILTGEGIGDVVCAPMNILMGPFSQLFLEFVMFGLFLCRGCHMLGIPLVIGFKVFVSVAGQNRTTMCPTLLSTHMVLFFVLACPTFATHPALAAHLAFTTYLTLTMHPTFSAYLVQFLLSVIASSSFGVTAFILQLRLWRGLGPLVLLIL